MNLGLNKHSARLGHASREGKIAQRLFLCSILNRHGLWAIYSPLASCHICASMYILMIVLAGFLSGWPYLHLAFTFECQNNCSHKLMYFLASWMPMRRQDISFRKVGNIIIKMLRTTIQSVCNAVYGLLWIEVFICSKRLVDMMYLRCADCDRRNFQSTSKPVTPWKVKHRVHLSKTAYFSEEDPHLPLLWYTLCEGPKIFHLGPWEYLSCFSISLAHFHAPFSEGSWLLRSFPY